MTPLPAPPSPAPPSPAPLSPTVQPGPAGVAVWRATLAGLCASLVGIGLARFAYTPLLPAIIGAGWFGQAAAAYLGAANLGGYLLGALAAGRVAGRVGPRPMLRGAMLVASISFFACAWPAGFGWFFGWRLLSGLAGGVAMVLAAPTVLPHVPPARRGLVSGGIFMGVGLGIAASGTLVPPLLRLGLGPAWIGLGMVALVLTAVGWNGWPSGGAATPGAAPPPTARQARQLRVVYAGYGLAAFGLVPHMVFLVDYVARGLGQGLAVGAGFWVLFGLGAVVGPLVTGSIADRIGARAALRCAYGIEATAVALPLLGGWAGLAVSSVVAGALTPGIVPLTLGRTGEILGSDPAARRRAWSAATVSFATMQAAGAYGLSFAFVRSGGDYHLLFAAGASALLVALALDLLTPEQP